MNETIALAAKALLEREGLVGVFETSSMYSINLDIQKRQTEVAFVDITVTPSKEGQADAD